MLRDQIARWLSPASPEADQRSVEPQPLDDISTVLMADVLSRVPAKRALVILDCGVGMASTVNFFSHFDCRIAFVDLLAVQQTIEQSEAQLRESEEGFVSFSKQQLVGLYDDALASYGLECIDICLFWDLPNYLPAEYFHALMESLRPRLHEHTLGHLIGAYNARSSVTTACYGLKDLTTLSQAHPRQAIGQRFHAYKQGEIAQLLRPMAVDRSRLLGEGRVEYLLKYHVPSELNG